ncbi:MAG: protein kinase, partial [Planctomycetota bacterium]
MSHSPSHSASHPAHHSDSHPDDTQLRGYIDESLSPDQQMRLQQHLESCDACIQRMNQIAAPAAWWSAAAEHLHRDDSSGRAGSETQPDTVDFSSLPTYASDDLGDGGSEGLDPEIAEVLQRLTPTDANDSMGRLQHYEVTGVVGTGATSIVLKAYDASLRRSVAIKALRPSLTAFPRSRERFEREARAAAAIVHPNVIEIYGVSSSGALPYLVMPYVRGTSLAKRIRESGHLSLRAALTVACQIADGLAAAHDSGVIHRDIKPANILLGDGIERVLLTDFGLARVVNDSGLTHTGTIAGTPHFMSPEQARGERPDPRSDLFSLGSLMYCMLSGDPPFDADNCYASLRHVVEHQPTPIAQIRNDLPKWVQPLLQWMMHKDAQQRPDSAAQLARELRQCVLHLGDSSQPLPKRLQSGISKTPRLLSMAMIFIVLVGTLGWFAATNWSGIADPPSNVTAGSAAVQPASADPEIPADQNAAGPSVRDPDTDPALRWDDGIDELIQESNDLLRDIQKT